ncbi:alpha/beta hydrolase [Companilactobacillus ginsenosidimutans]|uniref:Acyltransferase n=1 Tax=Companilactobacillus ginsenosidimutans TaxID=1007676 RepID=A0A0H4QMZ3_9LACO|nr:alpha/beta hydrolase [Companilactobacillus ginsenosidimutans]AKP68098.1 acyltransferase [Companilactobacillus ginsenosidimutans]
MLKKTLTTKKGLHALTFLFVALILLAIPSYFWTKKDVSTLAGRYNSPLSPIIMIPGSSASADRFDGLVGKINKKYDEHHSVLELTVHTNDTITYKGSIRNGDTRPFIVVGFENNQDGYDNIKKQARWFDIAFEALKKRYKFNNFDAFGHSNGGLIWTYYLENYFDDNSIHLHKMLTVGTPYNFEEVNSSKRTEMLNNFIKNRDKLPSNLTYYSVAGTKVYTDDGIVPIGSVDAGKYIFEGVAKHYTLITLTGDNAQHSDMLDNQQFISLFHQYIINDGVNPPNSAHKPSKQTTR